MFHSQARYFLAVLLAILLASCSASRHAQRQAASSRKADEALIKKYEALIGQPIDIHKSLALYKCIDKWMGTRYKYGGTGPSGIDCSGFASIVYKEVYNLSLPRSSEDQMKQAKRVKEKHLQEGQLVFFKIEKGAKVSHVGIYLGNHRFVHASTSKGVRIDNLQDEYYDKTFVCGGTYW